MANVPYISEAAAIVDLSEDEFRDLAALLKKRFGINLADNKKALMKARLTHLLKSSGHSSFRSYYDSLLRESGGEGMLDFVDRISTNHTFFFREKDHFSFLSNVAIPGICAQIPKEHGKLRIWSAGCSTGEEPYTTAMVLREHLGPRMRELDVRILATDISTSALDLARKGVYEKDKLKGVPPAYRKYFTSRDERTAEIDPEIKRLVVFRRLNLMRERYPFTGLFHIVFCRNVMIYFDHQTRNALVGRIAALLHRGGYLLIGHSESLGRDHGKLRYVQPTVYQR